MTSVDWQQKLNESRWGRKSTHIAEIRECLREGYCVELNESCDSLIVSCRVRSMSQGSWVTRLQALRGGSNSEFQEALELCASEGYVVNTYTNNISVRYMPFKSCKYLQDLISGKNEFNDYIKQENNMNDIHNPQHTKADNYIYLVQEGVVTVKVKFFEQGDLGIKEYVYRTREQFEVDDLALVNVNGNYKVVKITQVDEDDEIDMDCETGYKWIVTKIDTSGYLANLESDQKAREIFRTAKRKQSKAKVLEAMGFGGDTVDQLKALYPGVGVTAIESTTKETK